MMLTKGKCLRLLDFHTHQHLFEYTSKEYNNAHTTPPATKILAYYINGTQHGETIGNVLKNLWHEKKQMTVLDQPSSLSVVCMYPNQYKRYIILDWDWQVTKNVFEKQDNFVTRVEMTSATCGTLFYTIAQPGRQDQFVIVKNKNVFVDIVYTALKLCTGCCN